MKLSFSITSQRALRHFIFCNCLLLLAIFLPTAARSQSHYTPYAFTTLAGLAGSPGSGDSFARFNQPSSVAVDTNGNVYVADSGNYTIRKVTPAGVVTTLAGLAGNNGSADGTGSAARFGGQNNNVSGPSGVAVDSAGNVYVADLYNSTIRKGTVVLQFDTSAGSLSVSSGSFHARLLGPSSSNAVLEASANLLTWTPIQTNALPPFGLDVSVTVGAEQKQFFRARLAP